MSTPLTAETRAYMSEHLRPWVEQGDTATLALLTMQLLEDFEALKSEHDKLVRALTHMAYGDDDWSPTYGEADAAEEIADEAGIALDYRILRP